MRVRVRYFASLREARGTDEELADLPSGITAGAAYRHLCPPAELPVAYAVNHVRVGSDTVLAEGDELVFLPPVGGG